MLFTLCSFDTTKYRFGWFGYYRGKDHKKNFCKNLKEHAAKVIKYEKKKKSIMIILLTHKEANHIISKIFVTYTKKNLLLIMIKNIEESTIMVITQENIEVMLIIFVIWDKKYQKIIL